jgi:hypothetical protein
MMELFFIFLIIGILYFFGGQIIDLIAKILKPISPYFVEWIIISVVVLVILINL